MRFVSQATNNPDKVRPAKPVSDKNVTLTCLPIFLLLLSLVCSIEGEWTVVDDDDGFVVADDDGCCCVVIVVAIDGGAIGDVSDDDDDDDGEVEESADKIGDDCNNISSRKKDSRICASIGKVLFVLHVCRLG